jgi:hypothetical protein
MRGRPVRVLLLITLVPLLIVIGLLAVAAVDGHGAERQRAVGPAAPSLATSPHRRPAHRGDALSGSSPFQVPDEP